MCTPFRVSIWSLFSITGYKKRALFLMPVAKRKIFCKIRGMLFYIKEYFSLHFPNAAYHWKEEL